MGLVNSVSRKRPREEPEVIEITSKDEEDFEDVVEEISPRRYSVNSRYAQLLSISYTEKGSKLPQHTYTKHSLSKGPILMLLYTP